MSIINLGVEIKKTLPELESTSGDIKYLSVSNWNNRVKTIQTKIRKKYKSYSVVGLYKQYLNPCILEYQDGDTIVIDESKYKMIREYLLSDDFNIKN